ncbi:MAG TPA: hypothetical protein PL059_04470 [Spirochaetota bacterium]|nr:hypothetical protein [Spirochaetota bacterium]HOM09550.1 hypothetical protein [Spirochaetota bacterium]HPP49523.1 hypothetical protein [Spirochaetota bacterium]
MKLRTLLILCVYFISFFECIVFGNLLAINITEIHGWKSLESDIDFLWENQHMYRYFQPNWNYPIAKEQVVERLETLLKKLDKLEAKNSRNIEYYLLKGDIAHYLYNLDKTQYYKKALIMYEKAKTIEPRDYRPYWFIGQHEFLSGHNVKGYESFKTVIDVIPPDKFHWAFWGDYSNCASIGMMPFNFLMAFEFMHKNKAEFENIDQEPFFNTYNDVKKRVTILDPDGEYEVQKIWTKVPSEEIYISTPLGMRIHAKKSWQINPKGLQKRYSVMMMFFDAVKGNNNEDILAGLSIFTYLPKNGETLETHMKKYLDGFKNIRKVTLNNKFNTTHTYESSMSEIAREQDGMRVFFIFLERDEPAYPCVKIEYPYTPRDTGFFYLKEDATFASRFKGKIFYIIVFETRGSVYSKTYKMFNDFINTSLYFDE